MNIIDKAKGFYEDHTDTIKEVGKTVVCSLAGLGVVALSEYIGVRRGTGMAINFVKSEIVNNPDMLLTEFIKKYNF